MRGWFVPIICDGGLRVACVALGVSECSLNDSLMAHTGHTQGTHRAHTGHTQGIECEQVSVGQVELIRRCGVSGEKKRKVGLSGCYRAPAPAERMNLTYLSRQICKFQILGW